jgi:phosphinothricin acetyltransferase
VQVRDATAADVAAINHIYNATAVTTTVAWAEEPEALAARRQWFGHQQAAGNPVLVATDDGAVIGYASYADFRDTTKWPGYRFTVEHSVHVAESHHRAGVGRALMEALVARATARGKHVMIGAIAADNASSIRFHEQVGFSEVGRLPEVGFKFGRWLDLVLVRRSLG